jgi:uncharacterized DUF497 family protein
MIQMSWCGTTKDILTRKDRWNAVGTSAKLRVLSVTYTRRGHAIRIISARKATRSEAQEHDEA